MAVDLVVLLLGAGLNEESSKIFRRLHGGSSFHVEAYLRKLGVC